MTLSTARKKLHRKKTKKNQIKRKTREKRADLRYTSILSKQSPHDAKHEQAKRYPIQVILTVDGNGD